ncbi:MAG: FliG C-terminal domain-containing protein, partial [Nitratireductor sp.]
GADLLELVQAVEVDTSALESAEKAANMINFLPEETSDSLVEYIKSQNPALATSISKALFRFPMLEFLDKPTRAKIMDGVEASDLSKALIGGSDGLKEAVLDVTSQRNRRMIESEIALGGTPEAIEAARKKVASYVLKLVKEGAIELPSPDELGNEE